MHQKFIISRDKDRKELTIREYAIIDRNIRKSPASMSPRGPYSLLCEETYGNEFVLDSITKGANALVAALRTDNIFPIEPYAAIIAKSVTALYNSNEEGPVELFFNDAEMISA